MVVLGAWGMECPVSVSGAIRKLQSWCGEPLSRGWPHCMVNSDGWELGNIIAAFPIYITCFYELA